MGFFARNIGDSGVGILARWRRRGKSVHSGSGRDGYKYIWLQVGKVAMSSTKMWERRIVTARLEWKYHKGSCFNDDDVPKA